MLQQGILHHDKDNKEINEETYAFIYLAKMMIIKWHRRSKPILEHALEQFLRHVLRWTPGRLVRRLLVLGRLLALYMWLILEQLVLRIRIELLGWSRILVEGCLMRLFVLLVLLVLLVRWM
jgi:hypothetical protein